MIIIIIIGDIVALLPSSSSKFDPKAAIQGVAYKVTSSRVTVAFEDIPDVVYEESTLFNLYK